MANTTNLNIIFEALSLIPKIHNIEKIQKKAKTISQKKEEIQENSPPKTTRRLALSIGSIALFANSRIGNSLAEDNNGFFITGPLQDPSVSTSKLFFLSIFLSRVQVALSVINTCIIEYP
uniref:Oxygen-evolving enhancer protein 3-1, chloroplast n=1 Tax=Solanum tuberosum TaxID=4113 RepID=M1B570_SOLTU